MEPTSLQEAILYFADPENCREYLVARRWPDGVVCPRCQSKNVLFLEKYNRWHCREKHDAPQFTLKTGTIFEDSPIGLDKWLTAMWMIVNAKNGVSSWEIHRSLKVTQKTAWFMLHRVRLSMKEDFGHGPLTKIGGPDSEVEVDETFIGGKKQNMHKDKKVRYEAKGGASGKTVVQGILDRTARQVRATVVPNVKRETLQAEILKQVKFGTKVYTDDAVAYEQGLQRRYVHDFVNKTESYVRGRVHVNGMENFWSLLKRGLNGTYVAVEPFHLSRYIDEQIFRYNNRATKENPLNDSDRFDLAVRQIVGKRLQYKELVGQKAA
ncbi:MAG: IS1595 family transposase [Terriglobales bacterium]